MTLSYIRLEGVERPGIYVDAYLVERRKGAHTSQAGNRGGVAVSLLTVST